MDQQYHIITIHVSVLVASLPQRKLSKYHRTTFFFQLFKKLQYWFYSIV